MTAQAKMLARGEGRHGLMTAADAEVDVRCRPNRSPRPCGWTHPADFKTLRGGTYVDWIWEILRYVAAWGGTGLIIWFWYWMFSNIGTF
ncbi:hypothetical protein ABQF33_21020 [Mycolicibacterium sp. XJ2]